MKYKISLRQTCYKYYDRYQARRSHSYCEFDGDTFYKQQQLGTSATSTFGEVFYFQNTAGTKSTAIKKMKQLYESYEEDLRREAYQVFFVLGKAAYDIPSRTLVMPYATGTKCNFDYYCLQEQTYIVLNILNAVDRLHTEKERTHGDLRDDNILVDAHNNFNITLIDLGMTERIGLPCKVTVHREHIAPELQEAPTPPRHPNQDVFALGDLFTYKLPNHPCIEIFKKMKSPNPNDRPTLKDTCTAICDLIKQHTKELAQIAAEADSKVNTDSSSGTAIIARGLNISANQLRTPTDSNTKSITVPTGPIQQAANCVSVTTAPKFRGQV